MTIHHSPGISALIGPNAAGKTYYLRSLIGPDAAYVPAAADALFAGRTVADHIAWAREATPRAALTLTFDPSTRLSKLSVGQRRELTFTLALAAAKPLLLLDGPFDGLDAATRARLRNNLIDFVAADNTRVVIMASHRSEDLAGLADRVIRVFDQVISQPLLLDDARASFPVLTGRKADVDKLIAGRDVIAAQSLGPTLRAQLAEPCTGADGADGVELTYPNDAELIDLLATRKA